MLSLRRGLLIFAALAATTACAFGVGQILPVQSVQLGQNTKRIYSFHAMPNPSATQAAILEERLRTVQ
jgi:hypothetical protein